MELQHASAVGSAASAQEAWKELQDAYQTKSVAKRLQLTRELTALAKHPTESVSAYVGRARDLRDRLVTTGSAVADDQLVMSILAGLPAEYRMIVTVLEGSGKIVQRDVIAKLLTFESSNLASVPEMAQGGQPERAFFSGRRQTPMAGGRGKKKKRRHPYLLVLWPAWARAGAVPQAAN